MARKSVTIADFLTGAQVRQCIALYRECNGRGFARLCCDQIIAPNLADINAKLGQENDPMYLAYAVEYVMMGSVKL